MFNVSALLLDDALKPAMPLTNGAKRPTLIVTKSFINKQNFRKTLTKCQLRQLWRHEAQAEENVRVSKMY